MFAKLHILGIAVARTARKKLYLLNDNLEPIL
jgi:hypothetical protein